MAKKILIVDDDEATRGLVKTLLEGDYEISTASTGKEALAALKKSKYDLILLDYFMPEMSGKDVLEKVRADPKTKKLKAILLTVALFSEAGIDKVKELGIEGYIRKPFDNNAFKKGIKKVLT